MDIFKGKKTHIVALLLLAVGIVNMLSGDATGLPMIMEQAPILLNAFGLSALRAGVAKS